MNIGIMSMQRIINYGSFLQAYGLKKTIQNMGHTVTFVDYRVGEPLVSESISSNQKFESKFKRMMKVFFSPPYRMNRKQSIDSSKAVSNFRHTFQNEWLPMLGVTDERVYSPKLDVLVIGSDEVFNCTQPNLDVGYSPQLFGYENSAEKLITYAASFGSTTIEKLDKYGKTTEISNLLKEFDAISVRDKNSHDIIKTLTAIDPIDSIDPVLLYDFSNEVDNIDVDLSNYIVVYAYSGRINKIEAEAIQAFAHSKGKKTLSIGVKQSFTDLYVNVDPFTLLAYIKNADYVITDTFHGTVFSIKYQTPFATLIRPSNIEKLSDLLEKFDLSSRTVNDVSNIKDVCTEEIDKLNILKLLKTYRESAITYLKDNL